MIVYCCWPIVCGLFALRFTNRILYLEKFTALPLLGGGKQISEKRQKKKAKVSSKLFAIVVLIHAFMRWLVNTQSACFSEYHNLILSVIANYQRHYSPLSIATLYLIAWFLSSCSHISRFVSVNSVRVVVTVLFVASKRDRLFHCEAPFFTFTYANERKKKKLLGFCVRKEGIEKINRL